MSTPKRLHQSIRHDPVDPKDYARFVLPWSCEDCSHYCPANLSESEKCTLGYNPKWHKREYQRHTFELNGTMALCRFQEID